MEDTCQTVPFVKTLKILNTWSIAPCDEPSGLAILANKWLFVGATIRVGRLHTNGHCRHHSHYQRRDFNQRSRTGLAFASLRGTIHVPHQTRRQIPEVED